MHSTQIFICQRKAVSSKCTPTKNSSAGLCWLLTTAVKFLTNTLFMILDGTWINQRKPISLMLCRRIKQSARCAQILILILTAYPNLVLRLQKYILIKPSRKYCRIFLISAVVVTILMLHQRVCGYTKSVVYTRIRNLDYHPIPLLFTPRCSGAIRHIRFRLKIWKTASKS